MRADGSGRLHSNPARRGQGEPPRFLPLLDGRAQVVRSGVMTEEDGVELDPGFAERFEPADRGPCQLYLVSPLDVGGGFPGRLAEALEAGTLAAFQFRVKGVDQHEAARLAEPLQRLCADWDVAFIVNDDMSLAKRIGADGVHLGQGD